jgi:ankyrin repeat protein
MDWTVFNSEKQSLLHVVAARRAGNGGLRTTRLRRFEFLMGKGLDVFAEDANGQTALDIAAAGKADEILALFKVD